MAALTSASFAATVTFEPVLYPDANGADPSIVPPSSTVGVDGWTQSEPSLDTDPVLGPAPYFFTAENPLGGQGAFLGPYFGTPSFDPLTVSRSFSVVSTYTSSLGVGTYGGVYFGFEGTIVDSTLAFPDRNDFGVTLGTGGSTMFEMVLRPVTPDDATSDWQIFYTIAGGSEVDTGTTFSPGALVNFSVQFDMTGLTFSADGGGGGSITFSGTPTGYDSASTDDLDVAFYFTQGADTDFGDNGLFIDNVTVVPEPSMAVLGALGGLAFFRRRRK
ncbi:hypothetical protein Hsar01_02929 [Haloferula sargassicola]|uniref:Ice-binding protein C-terminal domain-containing protein n=2 Tax=Haloferula sargassicola TaxID=490096 RepID=A0ABP9UQ78_9BACT